MQLKTLLNPDCTLCAVQGSSKKRILEIISETAREQLEDFQCSEILGCLMAREKMGSTGLGNGIALPHGRLKGLKQAIAVLVTCTPAIEFDAIDNQPVDILFALLVPEDQAQAHLSTLATVATKFSDKATVKALRAATTKEQLLQVLI